MGIFDGKLYFVYGDGLSGRAALHALKKHGGKAKIYSDIDGRFMPPPDKHYDGAVISPGIRPTHEVYGYCASRGINTLNEAEIAFGIIGDSVPTVGVTGTNGKTTTTKLIADMLGGVACGNIGYPVSEAALKLDGRPIVCELSSFQLYNAVISPSVAVITNIASDHIDWHGSWQEYCRSKCNVAANMRGGYLILGEDIPIGALSTLSTEAQTVMCSSTGVCDGAYISDGYFCFMGHRVCPVDYLRLQGKHNVKNALCAIAAAMCLGADSGAVLSALSGAQPSAHRTEIADVVLGKTWIDDSKGTNVSACIAAIEQTSGSVCLILGGRGKATDFSELFSVLDSRVMEVVAMGETAQAIRDCAVKLAPELKLTVVNGLSDAVRVAAESDAETVLLSPACASFDEFENYAARGEKFKEEVKALGRRK